VSAALEGFGDDVERAINDVRDLAHGVYPAVLTSDGLSAALTCAARRAAPGSPCTDAICGGAGRRWRPRCTSPAWPPSTTQPSTPEKDTSRSP
jgi:hypothetical protein